MVAAVAGKNPSTHSAGGWLDPIAGLDSFVEEHNFLPLPEDSGLGCYSVQQGCVTCPGILEECCTFILKSL
jgi:hypothetical protein